MTVLSPTHNGREVWLEPRLKVVELGRVLLPLTPRPSRSPDQPARSEPTALTPRGPSLVAHSPPAVAEHSAPENTNSASCSEYSSGDGRLDENTDSVHESSGWYISGGNTPSPCKWIPFGFWNATEPPPSSTDRVTASLAPHVLDVRSEKECQSSYSKCSHNIPLPSPADRLRWGDPGSGSLCSLSLNSSEVSHRKPVIDECRLSLRERTLIRGAKDDTPCYRVPTARCRGCLSAEPSSLSRSRLR